MRKKLSRKGRKKKKKRRHRQNSALQQPNEHDESLLPKNGLSWMQRDGVHALLPGKKPSEQQLEKMTETYQRELRKSPLFKQWVKQYGKRRAVEMLKECRVELR